MSKQHKAATEHQNAKEAAVTFSTLLQKQKDFQVYLKKCEDASFLLNNIDFIKEQSMALIVEVTEALNEIPWKTWKKDQQLNLPAFHEELADIQLFLINLVIASGLSADAFMKLCFSKQQLNVSRQQRGY